MTNHDRNIRTLVLCFVLAVMALVPLRMVEVGNKITSASQTQVLGETIVTQEVVLPDAEIEQGEVLNVRYIGR